MASMIESITTEDLTYLYSDEAENYPGSHLTVKVYSVDTHGNVSTVPLELTDDVAPALVQNLVVTPGDGEILVEWDANTEDDLLLYDLWWDDGASPVETQVFPPNLSRTITGLDNGTEYTISIRAIDYQANNGEFATDTVVCGIDYGARSAAQSPAYLWLLDETSGTSAADTGVGV